MLKADDKVFLRNDILRGLGTVLAISKSGKTAKVKWPNPYGSRTLDKPAYYKLSSLLDENARDLTY